MRQRTRLPQWPAAVKISRSDAGDGSLGRRKEDQSYFAALNKLFKALLLFV
jgi:hypothetical protein